MEETASEDLISLDLVICTYNKAPLLDRTLAAIAAQHVPAHVAWHVLVVDNNCTDETPTIVEKHRQIGTIPSLSRVTEPRQGLTPARLCGIRSTTAPWIAFVDDDCLLREDWVAQAARFAQQHPRCGAFGGRVRLEWEAPPPAFALKYTYAFAEQDHGPEVQAMSYLVGAGLVVRRAALEASGWLKQQFLEDRTGQQLVSGGDMEMTLRLHGAGHVLWYVPACELRHHIPLRRTSVGYLTRINYGLGVSQSHVDALCWPGTYPAWLLTAARGAFRMSAHVLRRAARHFLQGAPPAEEVAIDWSFTQGRWAGIATVLRMDVRKRRKLLGCAKTATEAA